jgi:hypothetical protein
VSERTGTRIEHPLGPMHTGSGDLYVVTQLQEEQDGPTFRRLADDQLRRLKQMLVEPAGMGAARHTLADTHTVILDGPPGSGRTATARVLLSEHDRDNGVFHELLPGEEHELSLSNPDLVGAGDRLLLDLSQATAEQWAVTCADLSALRKAVHDQHAHLVVVMPHGRPLDPDLQHYRTEIESPEGLLVLRRHLRIHEVPFTPDPTVTTFLSETRPMREIAEFADLIRRARLAAGPDEGFAQWCTTARKARNDRRAEVATRVAALHEGPQRALLITVAMLHGAHADVIHQACHHLLRTLAHPPDEHPLLQRKDLAERLKEISAHTGADGRVRFTELDYDTAVIAHFWDHMPDLRQHLATWVAHSVDTTDPYVTRELRDHLVERLAGQYLRTGRPEHLAALAENWSSTTPTRPRLEAAVHALTRGLTDPAHGRSFRRWIYQWCATRQPTADFAQVLVQVCSDVIAVSHPDQALVRLHHLACREQHTTRALQALCDLVATSSRLRRRLLDRLTTSSLSPAELRIFLPVCDPVAMTTPHDDGHAPLQEDGLRASLTSGWRAVFEELPHPVWRPYAEHWLRTATDAEHHGDLLLDLLVRAAHQSGSRRGLTFAALYATARAAEHITARGNTQAAATTDRLLAKITQLSS